MNLILIYTLCPTPEDAKRIAGVLLDEKLIACANIGAPVISMYEWQGERKEARETPMFLKTLSGKYRDVEARIMALCPHDTPCIAALQASDVSEPYLDWVRGSLD